MLPIFGILFELAWLAFNRLPHITCQCRPWWWLVPPPLALTTLVATTLSACGSNDNGIAGSFKCKAGVPKAEFGNFWLNKHPKPFNSLDIVKKNIFKYKQVSNVQLIPFRTYN